MESNVGLDPTGTCHNLLLEKKFDILWNGSNQFAVYFKFKSNRIVECNQTMFDKAPWRAISSQ